MKRIVLFLATSLAVTRVLSVALRLLGVDRSLTANGLDRGALLVFSPVPVFTALLQGMNRHGTGPGFTITGSSRRLGTPAPMMAALARRG